MNSEVASSNTPQFSIEIEFSQSGTGQKVRQNLATAQQLPNRLFLNLGGVVRVKTG